MRNSLIKLLAAFLLSILVYSCFQQREKVAPQLTGEQQLEQQEASGKQKKDSLLSEPLLFAQVSQRMPQRRPDLDSLEALVSRGRRNAIVRAAERAASAVVSVNVLQTTVVQTPYRDFFGYFYVPRRRTVQNIGSGFIINARGYLLTNQHVVDQASKISVSASDGTTYDAEIVGSDPNSDVALLKIDPDKGKLSVAQLGDSDDLYIGEWVIAIGSPFGLLLDDPQPTVTVGVISAIGRDIVRDQSERGKVYANMIQTDAAINPGNSGGPLVNALGEVIGINTFIFSPSGGSVGMGFAIPINRAARIAEDLILGGKVRRPWLGIQVQDLTADILAGLGYSGKQRIQGVLVADIQPHSPAASGDALRPGDIITGLGGKPVHSVEDWTGEMLDIRVNSAVNLSVLRSSSTLTVALVPVEKPSDKLQRHPTGLGFELIDLTPEVHSQIEARSTEGAVIVEITDEDLVRQGSILPFDILYRINDVRITSAEQAVSLLKGSGRSKVTVLFLERDGRSIRRYLTR